MEAQALIRLVEVASIPILASFVLAQPKGTRKGLARDAFLLAVAAVLGEETCIALYQFYDYAPGWSLKVWRVPVMVGCIWPAVVLSARAVVGALLGRTPPLAVAALVLLDATLVEAVSVRAGLWGWVEGAVFNVPLIGVVGWAAYAGAASWAIDRQAGVLGRLLWPQLLGHAVLLVSWWGGLRWALRDPLPPALLVGLAWAVALGLAVALWPRRQSVPLAIMGPRALAASLFFALLPVLGGDKLPLVAFACAFSLPYLTITRWSLAAAPEANKVLASR